MNFILGGPIGQRPEYNPQVEALRESIKQHFIFHTESEKVAASKEFVKEWMKFQTALYDRISAFNQVVTGIGYVGYFATLNVCKNYINPKLAAISAVLMMMSISLFVVHEIMAMKQRESTIRNAFNIALTEPHKVFDAYADYQAVESEKAPRRARRSNAFFWIVMPLGVTSALLLISGVAWTMFKVLK